MIAIRQLCNNRDLGLILTFKYFEFGEWKKIVKKCLNSSVNLCIIKEPQVKLNYLNLLI